MTRKQALARVQRALARRAAALKINDRIGARKALAVARRSRKLAQRLTSRRVIGVSRNGVNLVASFEGFRSCPYRDAVGVWTIGYGETRGVGPNTKCVRKVTARALLERRLDLDFFPHIRNLPTFSRLTQNQVDALTSFIYNVGPGAIAPDTGIGQALRDGHFNTAANELLKWDRAGGRTLEGLVRRRKAERALFRK